MKSSTQIKRENFNKKIREERKEMTEILKKYVMINLINENHEHEECPYCTGPLTRSSNGGIGCDNCNLEIRDTDYLHAIKYVIKYGETKPPTKFKGLSEF